MAALSVRDNKYLTTIRKKNKSMNCELLISLGLAVAGMAAMVLAGGVPASVSALVYNLRPRWRWLWSAWLAAVAVTLLVGMTVTCDSRTGAAGAALGVGWLMTVCLVGVATMPLTTVWKQQWHNILGISAGLLSQAVVLLVNAWWLLVWWLMIPLMAGSMAALSEREEQCKVADGKGVLLAELLCAMSLYGCLLTKL